MSIINLNSGQDLPFTHPHIQPLGDSAILVRFADQFDDAANRQAVAWAHHFETSAVRGVIEIVPNLVSVLVAYDARQASFHDFSGEIRLSLSVFSAQIEKEDANSHEIVVDWGGETGPDLEIVAETLGMSVDAFIKRHNASDLRVLATGFAPGFVYCGMHSPELHLPRKKQVRPPVLPGSILFAAGQTAITATSVPTGWHVIGRTDFRNFDPQKQPATILRAGDKIRFVSATK